MTDRPLRILNVDDDAAGRYVVTRHLRRAGYEVLEAATGEEALRMLSEKPDLVLLDVGLPDIDGFEVCRRIKADPEHQSISVIHLTATVKDTQHKVRGLDSGADAYLVEPIDPAELIATIRSMVRLRAAEERARQLSVVLEEKVRELELQRGMRERFVLMLSHDLRTPLSVVRASAQIIIWGMEKPSPKVLAERIVRNVMRIDRMITDLLDVSRLRAGEDIPLVLEDTELRALVVETLKEMEAVHGDRFKLVEQGEALCHASRDGVKRVLENLIGNAVKYGEPKTPIQVCVTPHEATIEISVHNVGNPIPEESREHLFESFQRAPSADQGNMAGWGLGLALTRGIVRAHGGELHLESSAESGTTFTVTLPRDCRAAKAKADAEAPAATGS